MAKVTPWTDPGLPEAVEYDSDELELVRRRAIDGLLSLPRIGVGVGGLLLGTHGSGLIRILGSQEISCSHAFGPGFRLTDEEIAAATASGPEPDELQVVGWYCSKPRGKAELTEEDKRIFGALCPRLGQIALLIVPSTVDVSRAAMFTREAKGGILLPLMEAETVRQPGPEALPVIEQVSQPELPMTAPEPPRPALNTAQPLSTAPPARSGGPLQWSIAAVLCLLAVWGALASRDSWWPQSKLELRSFDSGDALTIEWNSSAVRGIDSGSLEIRDGEQFQTYPLDASQLRAGTISYLRKTGKVRVLLRAGPIAESVNFTGPPPSAVK
jgi:hypothetical protein